MAFERDQTACRGCRLPAWLCVCEHAPRLTIRTRLLLPVHVQDLGRTSNTVRLLALAIRNATVLGHGIFPDPADPASQVPESETPLVLFPGHGAVPLTAELVASLPSPPALIAPDGSWRQASRMVKRLPLLDRAQKVSLTERAFAGIALRRNQAGHHMSTYEAVTQALAVLEGEEIAEPLFEFYRRATDRMLFIRGKLERDRVFGGIPEMQRE
jgi:DTW domain-containing protein YfiP